MNYGYKRLSRPNIHFMSSEESEGESLVVHPIPWRSQYVGRMFNKIDYKEIITVTKTNKDSNEWKQVHKTISKWAIAKSDD